MHQVNNNNALLNSDKLNKIDRREWDTLKILTHNINGIKNDKLKLFNMVNWARKKDIKILGISNINIGKKEGKWINDRKLKDMGYTGYWSNKDQKIKGSRVAILVKNEWAKHIGSVISINPYLIEVKLFFKGVTIKVIQLYALPNDDITSK